MKIIVALIAILLINGCTSKPTQTEIENRVVRAQKSKDFEAAIEASNKRTEYYLSQGNDALAVMSATDTIIFYDGQRDTSATITAARQVLNPFKRIMSSNDSYDSEYAKNYLRVVFSNIGESDQNLVKDVAQTIIQKNKQTGIYINLPGLSQLASLIEPYATKEAEELYRMSEISYESLYPNSPLYKKAPQFYKNIGKPAIAERLENQKALLKEFQNKTDLEIDPWVSKCIQSFGAIQCGLYLEPNEQAEMYWTLNYYSKALRAVNLSGPACALEISSTDIRREVEKDKSYAASMYQTHKGRSEAHLKRAETPSGTDSSPEMSEKQSEFYSSIQSIIDNTNTGNSKSADVFSYLNSMSGTSQEDILNEMSSHAMRDGEISTAAFLKAATILSSIGNKTNPDRQARDYENAHQEDLKAQTYASQSEILNEALSRMKSSGVGLQNELCQSFLTK